MDRNQGVHYDNYNLHWSLSARRAWIEMKSGLQPLIASVVALRKESVDRNKYVVQCRKMLGVALRKESVDRNLYYGDGLTFADVALRKESVDRNPPMCIIKPTLLTSLSARRAWIEMILNGAEYLSAVVALRKESVDRNVHPLKAGQHDLGRSPQGERG